MNECIPMFSITGRPSREQLIKMLKYYLHCGIYDVMLYPRSGCEVEYMSEEWKNICSICIEFAKAHNMNVWLYDEFNWPSGSCAGRVTDGHENFVSKRFVVSHNGVSVEKTNASEYIAGARKPFLVDLLNIDAVKYFIELTHEKYFEWFHEYFGNTIKGIFTDEPSFCYSLEEEEHYAYYEGIDDDYFALCNRNIYEDIAEYHYKRSNSFSKYYLQLIGNRFKSTYIDTISRWCDAHNIILTGHMLHDDTVFGSIYTTGNILEALEKMGMPGVDEIESCPENDDFLFSQLQLLRAAGKKYAMAELFALGPCSMSPARIRQIIWYAAAYGINRYFLAISHLDGMGNYIKNHFFNNFSYAIPNADFLSYIVKTAEEASQYADKIPVAYVSVRYPYNFCAETFKNERSNKCFNLLKNTITELIDEQIPWKLISQQQKSDTEVTLSFTDATIYDENNKDTFLSPKECVKEISKKAVSPVKVTEASGELASGLLVKCYTDGSYIIIDRSDIVHEQRRLTVNGEYEVTLPCFGVHTDKTRTLNMRESGIKVENAVIKIENNNVIRSTFNENNEWRLNVKNKINIKINARAYPNPSEIFLDGKKLSFVAQSDYLTDCFNKLYTKTSALTLEEGIHIIKTETKDLPYMPAVIIEGDFDFKDNTLYAKEVFKNINGEYSFFPYASAVFEVKLPKNANRLYITFDDNMLFCVLKINGEETAQCAYAPYIIEIPKKFYGSKINCELCFYSTLAPLFGNADDSTNIKVWHSSSIPEKIRVNNLKIQEI